MINEKIAKWKGTTVVPTMARSGQTPVEELVSVTKHKRPKDGKYPVLYISIHPRAVKSAGWIAGDRIEISIDNEGNLILHRATGHKGRRLLTPNAKNKGRRHRVCFPVYNDFWEAITPGYGQNVEISGGVIAFGLE